MNSKQIGKLIYNLDLGKYNNKTKVFESNNKDNWWRSEESYNKYHPLNSNTNNLLYKEYEQEYLYQNLENNINEITEEIYKSDGILFYITSLQNKIKFINTGLLERIDNKIFLYKSINHIKFDTCIKDWLILKVNIKDRKSYKENDKSTMYRFFEDSKSQYGIFTYENIDPQCISIYKEIRLS